MFSFSRYVVDRLVKLIFIGLFAWFLYSNSHVFMASFEYLDNSLKNKLPSIGKVKADDGC